MVLYFSATGNSKYVAERIATALDDEALNLFERIRNKDYSELSSEKTWIVVAPTYAWQLPRIIKELLEKTTLTGNKDIYFVLTCGGEIGNAGAYAKKICDAKALRYKGIAGIKMPDNYIAMFKAPEKDKALEMVNNAEPSIDKAIESIKKNEQLHETVRPVDHFLSGIVNDKFYKRYVKDDAFTITGRCNGCGLCEKLCPLGNVTIKDGHPIWNGNCTQCMACICHCPTEAIEYGKSSVGKVRYTCPK